MTVHRNRFLVKETIRCTEFQFYWYYDSTCFGQPYCPSSGVLSRTSALVHFMQLWWTVGYQSRVELQFNSTLVANGSSQLHKMYQSPCTAKNSWWWAERLPEKCRVVIPIKLEFSASVGFIHKELATSLLFSFFPFVNHKIKTHRKIVQLLLPFFGECLFEPQQGQAVQPFV